MFGMFTIRQIVILHELMKLVVINPGIPTAIFKELAAFG
jgi:hypothetical protein